MLSNLPGLTALVSGTTEIGTPSVWVQSVPLTTLPSRQSRSQMYPGARIKRRPINSLFSGTLLNTSYIAMLCYHGDRCSL